MRDRFGALVALVAVLVVGGLLLFTGISTHQTELKRQDNIRLCIEHNVPALDCKFLVKGI